MAPGALCFLGCAFTRTMEIFISGSTASAAVSVERKSVEHTKRRGGLPCFVLPLFFCVCVCGEGFIWIYLEKTRLDVGNFQRSNWHVSGYFCRTRWFDQTSVLKNHLARISMRLCHVPLCISHFFLNKSLDPTIKWRVEFKSFQILNLWGALKDLYDNFSHKSFYSGIQRLFGSSRT